MVSATAGIWTGAVVFGWLFWVCLSIGCASLVVLHHTLRGSWGLPLLRVWEAGAKTLYFMWIGFVALYFMREKLYAWAVPDMVKTDHILQNRAIYMNPTGFLIRGLIYFTIWIVWSSLLTASARKQDASGDTNLAVKRMTTGAFGIVFFVIAINFAMTDWIMTLDPHWYSTIFGVWFVICNALCAMAFAVYQIVSKADKAPYAGLVTAQTTRDWGNMLLMLCMVWAYFTFSQFLIIWSGNIPEEVGYFHHRLQGFWNGLGTIVVVGQFFVPFLLLLSGRTKRTPNYLKLVAIWIFGARLLDMFWNIGPFFVPVGRAGEVSPLQLAGPFLIVWALMGVVWYLGFMFFKKQSSLLPTHDARLRVQEAGQHA